MRETLFDVQQYCDTPQLPFEYSDNPLTATSRNGTAAELLVVADLMFSGYTANLIPHWTYDVMFDTGATKLAVQVKCCTRMSATGMCSWIVAQHGPQGDEHCFHSAADLVPYTKDDFDILALVAAESRRIGYLNHCDWDHSKTTISLKHESNNGRHINGFSLERAIRNALLEEYLP